MPWPGPDALPGLLGVDHVGVAVADLDEALALYRDVLGLTLTHRETNADQRVAEAMLSPAGDASATPLQLVAPLDADSPVARFLARRHPRLADQLCPPEGHRRRTGRTGRAHRTPAGQGLSG